MAEQIRTDEAVEIAVEHALRVSSLEPGAVVLHELVRLEDVAADLAAEADVLRLAALAGKLGLALLLPELRDARPRMRSAVCLFAAWERSFWHWTTMPVGRCVSRTAESVLLTCWPPAPLARIVSTFTSDSAMSTLMLSSITG